MLSVVIPILNEADTIADVVRFARRNPLVDEVLVIDDGSTDESASLALAAGAQVFTSSMLGKGVSMHDGLMLARNDYVAFLDGDLRGLDETLLDQLYAALQDGADFVKARFGRSGGRVTELTAKPLLKAFFPELSSFQQPLGGIVAGRRDFLLGLDIEDGYGVDIGLLIDAHLAGARIVEVDVGQIEHDPQPLANLARMATEVSRVIFDRAEQAGRYDIATLRAAAEEERQLSAEIEQLAARVRLSSKLALFDMDGTLLEGRFALELARATGREAALLRHLDQPEADAATRSSAIAAVFKDVPQSEFIRVAKTMPLRSGAAQTLIELKKRGYTVGVVSDSYFIAAEVVRRRVFAHFGLGHIMQFEQRQATGQLRINPFFQASHGCQLHPVCKRNVLSHLENIAGQRFEQVLVVGDGDNDLCLLRAAHSGFAIGERSPALRAAAKAHLSDLPALLDLC